MINNDVDIISKSASTYFKAHYSNTNEATNTNTMVQLRYSQPLDRTSLFISIDRYTGTNTCRVDISHVITYPLELIQRMQSCSCHTFMSLDVSNSITNRIKIAPMKQRVEQLFYQCVD